MSNVHQQHAINTFTTMLSRAESYRHDPLSSSSDNFYSGYGICDNIGRCKPQGADESVMSMIKDNVIRRLPSYSGCYHYPVKSNKQRDGYTVADEAENAWGNNSDKWLGEYGANRVQQLRELIDYVTNNWRDELAENMTPAKRVGIIQNVTVVRRIPEGDFFTLQYDDSSCDPYFMPLGGTPDDRRSIDLRRIEIVKTEDQPKRSLKSFLKLHAKTVAKREALEMKLKELKAEIETFKREEAMLDYALGQQHGVKRL